MLRFANVWGVAFCLLLLIFLSAQPALADCEPQLASPVKDWRFNGKWRSKLLLAEFAVTSEEGNCPTQGYIRTASGSTFTKLADQRISFWIRLQGNRDFFIDRRAFEITGIPVVDEKMLGEHEVDFVITYVDTGEPHLVDFDGRLNGNSAHLELAYNEERLGPTPADRVDQTRYFDWRFRAISTNVMPQKIKVQVLVGGNVVPCRPLMISSCECPGGIDGNCGVIVDLVGS